jgi:hypothetical protein
MTSKLNCWQFKNCGREPGGVMAEILGECPVAATMKYDGLNDGVGAGRACWMVPDSACRESRTQLTRVDPCHACEFYKRVVFEQEEATRFRFTSISI